MAQITLPQGIASISGRIGNIVFRNISGVQYVKRNHYAHLSDAEFRQECTATLNQISQDGSQSDGNPDNGSIMDR